LFLDAGTELRPDEREFFDCASPPLHQPTDVVANGWPTGSHNLRLGAQKCRPRRRGL
jgi:hypothetical protein